MTTLQAEKALKAVTEQCEEYKPSSDYVMGRNTSYFESFNHDMNIYTDKRTSFSNQEYNARSNLAVLQWNENMNREHTSVWTLRDQRDPRKKAGKKLTETDI